MILGNERITMRPKIETTPEVNYRSIEEIGFDKKLADTIDHEFKKVWLQSANKLTQIDGQDEFMAVMPFEVEECLGAYFKMPVYYKNEVFDIITIYDFKKKEKKINANSIS